MSGCEVNDMFYVGYFVGAIIGCLGVAYGWIVVARLIDWWRSR